ncbi:MAG: hypothetical protein ACUVWX_09640 [Kiritimatiellia bacterium]
MNTRCGLALFGVLLAIRVAADVGFESKPAVKVTPSGVTIDFALTAPSDVEVAILDAQGQVVRHLAAGVVGGPRPPPSPLRANLHQILTWDSRDDLGNEALGAPFRVRVRAGMEVRVSRLLGADPYLLGFINSIAVDENGFLFIMAGGGELNQNFDLLRAFAPDGTYLRTIIPFPANLPPDSVTAFARWDESAKAFRPINRSQVNPSLLPWVGGARVVSASRRGLILIHGTSLWRLDLQGGNCSGPFPLWPEAAKLKNPSWNVPQLAASSDGRYLYIANVAGSQYDTKAPSQIDPNWPNGRVYRLDTGQPGAAPQPWFDLQLPDYTKTKYWLPNAWNKRTAAHGLDVDDRGNVYVCDLVNQEVVRISPDGKKTASVKVPWPDRLHVNRKSGELYVISRQPRDGSRPEQLLKVQGWGEEGRIVVQMALSGRLGEASAIGHIKGRPVIWLADGAQLVCVEDAGDHFEPVSTAFLPTGEGQRDFSRIALDASRDEVYASNGANRLWRYDGKTGRGELLKTRDGKPFLGVDLAVGYDGLLYVRTGASYSGPLERYTRELEPAPFASGTHVLSRHIYSRYGVGNCEKGLGVGPKGEVYISFMYGWNQYLVAGFGGDGKPLKGKYLEGIFKPDPKQGYPPDLTTAIVGPVPMEGGGVRVDLQGNIYVGARVFPKQYSPPPEFAKDPAYTAFSGSVVKFGPDGGPFLGLKDAESKMPDGPRIELSRNLIAENALAVYPGVAPFSGGEYGGNSSACVCRVPRFDVDRYGRLALPHCVKNSVTILDNAGNTILEFGQYGNFDSQFVLPGAERPLVPVPEVPLGWPTGAALNDEAVYVNDMYNRRIVRGDLTWKVTETCAIP